MPKDEVEEIILHIKSLRLQEERALVALEAAHRRSVQRQDSSLPNPPVPSPIATPSSSIPFGTTSTFRDFAEGDRILIRNKVLRPINRPVNQGDRIGIVTKVTRDRIHFRTNNGTTTWRAPHNISHLPTQE